MTRVRQNRVVSQQWAVYSLNDNMLHSANLPSRESARQQARNLSTNNNQRFIPIRLTAERA